ncbi:MAG: hypothetical protein GC161_18505 [Planctomycetaceae bacterium]|nr:hypothetical protein [Planctomycetaceae bacterium]
MLQAYALNALELEVLGWILLDAQRSPVTHTPTVPADVRRWAVGRWAAWAERQTKLAGRMAPEDLEMVQRGDLGDVPPAEIIAAARKAARTDAWARWSALGVAVVVAVVLSAVLGAAAGWMAASRSAPAVDAEAIREMIDQQNLLRRDLRERLDLHAEAIRELKEAQQKGEQR